LSDAEASDAGTEVSAVVIGAAVEVPAFFLFVAVRVLADLLALAGREIPIQKRSHGFVTRGLV
jgi:hypothetical protein